MAFTKEEILEEIRLSTGMEDIPDFESLSYLASAKHRAKHVELTRLWRLANPDKARRNSRNQWLRTKANPELYAKRLQRGKQRWANLKANKEKLAERKASRREAYKRWYGTTYKRTPGCTLNVSMVDIATARLMWNTVLHIGQRKQGYQKLISDELQIPYHTLRRIIGKKAEHGGR